MKRLSVALILLAACSATTGTSSPPADASSDAVVTADVPVENDVAPSPDVPPTPDVPTTPDVSTTRDVPATPDAPTGPFTATPYLSSSPVRTFTAATQVLQDGRDYRAVMETDAGRMVLDLFEVEAPITVNSFVFLALNHFFEGIAFHRVIEGFVAQAGDPNTLLDNRARWGTGGPGYSFDTETDAPLTYDVPGVLGMARAAARNTNGSQFFITLAAAHNLDGMYTIFGRVTEGAAVLDLIARNATSTTPPTTPTRIMRVTIEERPR